MMNEKNLNLEDSMKVYYENIAKLKNVREKINCIEEYVVKEKGNIVRGLRGQKCHYDKLEYFAEETTEYITKLMELEFFNLEDYNKHVINTIKKIISFSSVIEGCNPGDSIPFTLFTVEGYFNTNEPVIIGIKYTNNKTSIIKSIAETIFDNQHVVTDATSKGINLYQTTKHVTKLSKKSNLRRKLLADNASNIVDSLSSIAGTTVKAVSSGGTSLIIDAPKTTVNLAGNFNAIKNNTKLTKDKLQSDKVMGWISLGFFVAELIKIGYDVIVHYNETKKVDCQPISSLYGLRNNFLACNQINITLEK